jgi:hypothetical protein
MSKTEFFRLVEADLRLRHVGFDRRQLEEFCRSMYPLAFEGDDWAWWADTFLDATDCPLPALNYLGPN